MSYKMLCLLTFYIRIVTVNFGHSSYEVMEGNEAVNIMLLLSEISLYQFEVYAGAMDLTATGKVTTYVLMNKPLHCSKP